MAVAVFKSLGAFVLRPTRVYTTATEYVIPSFTCLAFFASTYTDL